MKIFRSIGLGIAIVTLKLILPDLWHSFETTLIVFFSTLQKTFAVTPAEFMQGNVINFPTIPVR